MSAENDEPDVPGDQDQYLPMDNTGLLVANGGSHLHQNPHPTDQDQHTYVDVTKPQSQTSAVSPPPAPNNTRRTTSFSPAPKTPLKAMPSSDVYMYHEQQTTPPVGNDYEVPLHNEYELPTDAKGLVGALSPQRVRSPPTEATI